jgi:hypothetical protein
MNFGEKKLPILFIQTKALAIIVRINDNEKTVRYSRPGALFFHNKGNVCLWFSLKVP